MSKCNPKATPGSAVRRAMRCAAVAAVVWCVAAYFKPAMRANGDVTLPAWVCIAAVIGALCEWQVAEGIDTGEYVERLERAFGIEIPDEATEAFVTLGDLCADVARLRREAGREMADAEVWEAVRRITSYEFGVREDELQPETRFVEDLHC